MDVVQCAIKVLPASVAQDAGSLGTLPTSNGI